MSTSYHKLMHAEYCEWVTGLNPLATVADCDRSYKSFRGEHIVTDAGLRRALARHRTTLANLYNSLRWSSVPLTGHALERMWLTIFKGVVSPEACPLPTMQLS